MVDNSRKLQVHDFERGRIGPVDVLEQLHRRLLARDRLGRIGERTQGRSVVEGKE